MIKVILAFYYHWASVIAQLVKNLPAMQECVCVCVCESLSHVWLFATPWTVALQASLSKEFPRQEYWSGLPVPSPEDLPDLEFLVSCIAGRFFTIWATGKSYARDPNSIPGSGRSAGEGIGYPLQYSWAYPVAQLVKNPPARRETWVWSLGWEDLLEKGKGAQASILAWRIPWTVWTMNSQRLRHDWATFTFILAFLISSRHNL